LEIFPSEIKLLLIFILFSEDLLKKL